MLIWLAGSTLSQLFPIASYKLVVLLAGFLLIFYVSNLIYLKPRSFKFPSPTPLSILFILFLSWSALGYLFSADPGKSLYLTILSLSAILLYLGLKVYIETEEQVKNILKILVCFGAILAILGILQQFPLGVFKNSIQSTGNNSTSLFVHKNIFSGYLVFLIPLSCLNYLDSFSKPWKLISVITFTLCLVAIFFTGSRGGQLVAIFALLIILAYLIFNNGRKTTTLFVVGVFISIFLFFTIDFIAKTQLDKFGLSNSRASLVDLTEPNKWKGQQWFNRILFWQGGWEIFKDHWLIGSGPNSFQLLFPKYYLDIKPIIKGQVLSSGAPPHAHNLFVQTASDSGIVGLVLMLSFLIIFYIRGYKLLRYLIIENRPTVFFFLLSMTCFLIHHLVEYNWYGPIFIYHFTFFIFVIDFIYRKKFEEKNGRPNEGSFILFLFGIIVIFLTSVSSFQYYKFNVTFYERFLPETNLKKMSSLFDRLKQYCSRCDKPNIMMALKFLNYYKIFSKEKYLTLAKEELTKGQELNPYNPEYKAYLAQVYSVQGDHVRALALLKEAMRFNRTHYIRILGLGGAFPKKN